MHAPKRGKPRRLVLLISAWMIAATVAPAPAIAQPASAEATSQTQARAAYTRGVEAFSQQRFAEALDHFSLAEKLFPSPNIALMLGRTLAKLGRFADARSKLQQAQATASAPKYASTAALAEQELHLVEPKLGQLQISPVELRGDEMIRVNGAELAPASWRTPLLLDPGEVEVVMSSPDAPPTIAKVLLTSGATTEVTLRPQPRPRPVEPEPPAKAAVAIPPTRERVARESGSSQRLRGVSYALGGVAAAGLVGFAIFGAFSHTRYAKLEELCPQPTACDPDYRWLASSGRSYQTLANTTLVASGLMLTGAVTLWILSLDGTTEVAVSANGVQLKGKF